MELPRSSDARNCPPAITGHWPIFSSAHESISQRSSAHVVQFTISSRLRCNEMADVVRVFNSLKLIRMIYLMARD
jgi:hypothetical protein